MRSKLKALLAALPILGLLMPLAAYAAPRTFADLVYLLISFVNPLAGILATVAVLIFFWGIVQYIYSAGGEGHQKGRELMVWGIIALFVLFSVWGLARIVVSTFFGSGTATSPNGSTPSSSSTARPYLNGI